MTMITADQIRQKYLEFFKEKGHAIVPSASLVPENDPTTLFTGSGMQPMVPYLLGETHPLGRRIADSQKSFRAVDIEEVGDNRHTTFFEMLGNWSLGDYFKKEQIPWMFDFLVNEIGIDPNKLYVSVFIGDEKNNIPKDTESVELWKQLFAEKGIIVKDVEIGSEENGYNVGMQGGRIFYYNAKKNWWSRAGVPEHMPAGEPGGPDSEMFYDFGTPHDPKFGKECHPNCDCGRFLEIGNNVFMEYKKNSDGTFSKLPQSNVDFGGGLERLAMAVQNTNDIFNIDIFSHLIKQIEKLSGTAYLDESVTASYRVVADHIRASVFLIGDGIVPSNTDQGYFVRRLLRRAVRYWDKLGITETGISVLVSPMLEYYKDTYPETYSKKETIIQEIEKEEEKFRKTLKDGLKQFEKGVDPFILFTTYGFPFELTQELAKEKGIVVDENKFRADLEEHQKLSRSGSEQKFKGGLASTGEMETKYHTATHLLHKALQEVLGENVIQKGSNITPERLRFDFTHGAKMTDEEKKKVENIVNEKIQANLPVQKIIMKKEEAEKTGAMHAFGDKYGDEVSVYFVGDSLETAWSKEFCGGPHMSHTGELGVFKILKEEAVSVGVRRIKAILE
ncbi:MAG: alanine--tRNA ligase [bacterium]